MPPGEERDEGGAPSISADPVVRQQFPAEAAGGRCLVEGQSRLAAFS